MSVSAGERVRIGPDNVASTGRQRSTPRVEGALFRVRHRGDDCSPRCFLRRDWRESGLLREHPLDRRCSRPTRRSGGGRYIENPMAKVVGCSSNRGRIEGAKGADSEMGVHTALHRSSAVSCSSSGKLAVQMFAPCPYLGQTGNH